MNIRKSIALGLAMVSLWASALPAIAGGRDLAVLVVGRATDKDMGVRERAIIDQLTRMRVQRGWNHKLLPIYSYHFDKSAERAYCEDRLKVRETDLIVVGLVELESGVPVDFVYRENDVTSADPLATKIMDRARAELAARGRLASTAVPDATSPPPKPVAPTVSRPTPSQPGPASHAPVAVTTAPIAPAMQPVAVHSAPAAPPVVHVAPAPAAAPPVAAKPVAMAQPTSPHPPAAVTGNEKWAVQVGLFSTLEKARALADTLKDKNLSIEIYKGLKNGVVVFRVLLGAYHSQAEAYNEAKSLQEGGLTAFSVKIDPAALGQVVK